MLLYLAIALATLGLGGGLGANVEQMKEAIRNEGQHGQTASDRTESAKTCHKNGKQGECIQVNLCDDNDTIITDGDTNGKPIIEFRDLGDCNDYLLKCCFLRKQEIVAPEIPKGCGWANPEGVGFKIKHSYDGETNFAEFPWTVALHKRRTSNLNKVPRGILYKYLGGGSLIHRKVVLTAAHYLVGEAAGNIRVRAGEWDMQSKNEPYLHQDRIVRELVTHSGFRASGIYDIALLFLESAVEMAPNVGVACLAPAGVRVAAGTSCIATGWGRERREHAQLADILKRVELPVVDRAQCQAELRLSALGRHYILDGSFMCAGGSGKDTCIGDGGAPLVCPSSVPNRYIQYGIVSWGIQCHVYPGVYADVGYLRGWVDDTVRSHGYDPSVYTLNTTDGRV